MDEAKPQGDALDQLARDAADGAQFEFNPAAWDAMEKKLDAPKRGFFWWRLGGGLGVLAILLFFIFKPYGEPSDVLNEGATRNIEDTTHAKKIDPSGVDEDKNITAIEKAANNPSSEGNDVSEESENNRQAAIDYSNQSVAPKQNVTEKPGATAESNRASTSEQNKSQIVSGNINSASAGEQNVSNAVAEDARVSKNESQANYFELPQPNTANDSIGVREADLYEASLETITPEWFPPKYLFDLSLKPMTLDSGNYRTPEVDSLQPFKRWSFGVLVSFDLSATGLDDFTKPGLMLGLQAEYNVSRKWSIQSGVSYSVKNYRALGSEYNTAAWPGGRSDNLITAEARCLVIDIPLNIRRYFEGRNGNKWFMNTGVSTYLMLREDYDYEYTRPSPNWAPTGQVKGENNHVFGIANVSFGYETTLNKKFRIAVEPFMKLPLTGIGQGEVKFLSFGTNLVFKLK